MSKELITTKEGSWYKGSRYGQKFGTPVSVDAAVPEAYMPIFLRQAIGEAAYGRDLYAYVKYFVGYALHVTGDKGLSNAAISNGIKAQVGKIVERAQTEYLAIKPDSNGTRPLESLWFYPASPFPGFHAEDIGFLRSIEGGFANHFQDYLKYDRDFAAITAGVGLVLGGTMVGLWGWLKGRKKKSSRKTKR